MKLSSRRWSSRLVAGPSPRPVFRLVMTAMVVMLVLSGALTAAVSAHDLQPPRPSPGATVVATRTPPPSPVATRPTRSPVAQPSTITSPLVSPAPSHGIAIPDEVRDQVQPRPMISYSTVWGPNGVPYARIHGAQFTAFGPVEFIVTHGKFDEPVDQVMVESGIRGSFFQAQTSIVACGKLGETADTYTVVAVDTVTGQTSDPLVIRSCYVN